MSTERKILYRRIANVTTNFRIIIGLPILISLSFNKIFIALLLIILGGISDWLDGFMARKAGGGTSWGAEIDPLADKILLIAPFLWLTKNGILPIWAVWILFTRELVITSWRKSNKKAIKASITGKLKTFLQFFSVIFLIYPNNILIIKTLGYLFFWLSFIASIISAYKYIKIQSV
ncbi:MULTISPECIES: CDP-alcohol phosphatidyltransferase family protein [unclassified Prochlorococcus]|uniref:CDP-alcohol phosphatidyltransferase family protein n=1 Tax=unclassified Prochlorococcus TaxID=2627481 RepID=UPI00053375EF|nr:MULTISPECIES: CDP-alcohol phosphatidyltransferase family protein [unclassified Prochlorococcus]KGG15191.1 Phosphatidylglycerophosphate synthase [Prochlorococcus sp. MIT 0602]KGG17465.1 Phosphatidylglycerophosphate synthase [Prochlorococcus sp. MIT 0603]